MAILNAQGQNELAQSSLYTKHPTSINTWIILAILGQGCDKVKRKAQASLPLGHEHLIDGPSQGPAASSSSHSSCVHAVIQRSLQLWHASVLGRQAEDAR